MDASPAPAFHGVGRWGAGPPGVTSAAPRASIAGALTLALARPVGALPQQVGHRHQLVAGGRLDRDADRTFDRDAQGGGRFSSRSRIRAAFARCRAVATW